MNSDAASPPLLPLAARPILRTIDRAAAILVGRPAPELSGKRGVPDAFRLAPPIVVGMSLESHLGIEIIATWPQVNPDRA